MNGLGVIACGAGLQDGLNPCLMMTCAVFIALGYWLSKASIPCGWTRSIFVLVYGASLLVFNFTPAQIFLFQKYFVLIAKILYSLLSVGAFILGVLFFKDWLLTARKKPSPEIAHKTMAIPKGKKLPVLLAVVFSAVVMGALATLWPINNYIMLLGNITLLRGQWHEVMLLLIGYVVCSLWPLWLVWSFLGIKNLRPSLVKIVSAAVFFSATSVMVLVIKLPLLFKGN